MRYIAYIQLLVVSINTDTNKNGNNRKKQKNTMGTFR